MSRTYQKFAKKQRVYALLVRGLLSMVTAAILGAVVFSFLFDR